MELSDLPIKSSNNIHKDAHQAQEKNEWKKYKLP